MSRGFAVSGSTSTGTQGSTQRSSSFGESYSKSGQRYDPLAQQIRRSLFDRFAGGAGSQPQVTFQAGFSAPGEPAAPAPGAEDMRNMQRNLAIARANNEALARRQASSGYGGPQITIGDVYSPQQTREALNHQLSQNAAATQAYVAGIPRSLAGRGFAGAGSPLAMELERRANQRLVADNAALGTMFPFQIAKDNAAHRLASESAAQGFYRQQQSEEIARRQAANQAASTAAQERIAQLNAGVSERNALLNALAGLAQPLQRSKSTSRQGSDSYGSSFGKSRSTSYNVQPYSFESFGI